MLVHNYNNLFAFSTTLNNSFLFQGSERIQLEVSIRAKMSDKYKNLLWGTRRETKGIIDDISSRHTCHTRHGVAH